MSTQHPDNASMPPWCNDTVIQGDAEVYEAYFAYSVLGCQEVMWDSEGKDTDTRVVRKLLSNHVDYFKEKVIGRDIFLTYRIPNPRVEVAERKIVFETLANIPVGCDVASTFHECEVAPIFEVILPFTTNAKETIWLFNYYKQVIAAAENVVLHESVRVKDWIGSLKPSSIEVIPLVEDMKSILGIAPILEQYIAHVHPRYVRVFIARSDPALNYGLVCSTILSKLALSKLKSVEKKTGVPIYPILGVGPTPFRGHLSPRNLQGFLDEYRGVYTVTIQSALKYDYPLAEVQAVIRTLDETLPCGEPTLIEPHEEKTLLGIIAKFKTRYQMSVEGMAPLINSVASCLPRRRARKLHTGLFGYSRNISGTVLPRAIPFVGALYSLGIPPEFIGSAAFNSLNDNEWHVLNKHYVNLKQDFTTAARYVSRRNIDMIADMHKQVAENAEMEDERLKSALTEISLDLQAAEGKLGVKLEPADLCDKRHENTANNFLISYLQQSDERVRRYLEEAARIRRCIG
jgi:phosphoenolpyruvate carboxylase